MGTPADELFLVFSQWVLQLFQERRAQTRGGLIKSEGETRGGGGLLILSCRGVSDPDHVQIPSALVVLLPVNSKYVRSRTSGRYNDSFLSRFHVVLEDPPPTTTFSLPVMRLSFQAASVLLLDGIQPN